MYNEALKHTYLSHITSSAQRTAVINSFKITEKYEELYKRDLCMFNASQLNDALKDMVTAIGGDKSTRIQIVKTYIKWCVENGVEGAIDETANVDVQQSDEIRKRMVSGPAHLQRCLNNLFSEESKETVDNVYRCYMWLLFSGIDIDDVVRVTSKDVRLDDRIIVFDGVEHDIYKEAMPCITNCVKLQAFRHYSPRFINQEYTIRDRVAGDELVRGIRGMVDKISFNTHLYKSRMRSPQNDVSEISQKSVYMSGIFYRQYEIDRSTGNADEFGATWITFRDIIRRQKGKKNLAKASLKSESVDWLRAYNAWKRTFS